MQVYFRAIPSVDICLRTLAETSPLIARSPQMLVRDLVASYWDKIRDEIRENKYSSPDELTLERQLENLTDAVHAGLAPNLKSVINATGVVIHTNLGRSVLAREASDAACMAASGYSNLEMDLATGERGSRHDITEKLICRLTGAEAALVVNNNAAAVLLILDTLCSEGETIVSRGELIEIGGSFRIPDIMAKSGSFLREVGTTNRTHLKDYREAINENTKAILSVHTSNFRIIGFHTSVELKELAALAREHDLPLIFDLGSGSLLDLSSQGLPPEPTVSQALQAGADCACFSGDKVLGGPQAGIIAGKKKYISEFKKNPLTRALRCDKLCLAALEATLRLYLDPEEARMRVPTLHMISKKPEELARAAQSLGSRIKSALGKANIPIEIKYIKDCSRVGGGAFPECNLPTTLVSLTSPMFTALELRSRLLKATPPVIGRVENDAFCLDPRTIGRSEYGKLVGAVLWAAESLAGNKC